MAMQVVDGPWCWFQWRLVLLRAMIGGPGDDHFQWALDLVNQPWALGVRTGWLAYPLPYDGN